MTKYIVNKYSGRVYCGNGNFDTFDECIAFANDGFCDKAKIVDTTTNQQFTVKIQEV